MIDPNNELASLADELATSREIPEPNPNRTRSSEAMLNEFRDINRCRAIRLRRVIEQLTANQQAGETKESDPDTGDDGTDPFPMARPESENQRAKAATKRAGNKAGRGKSRQTASRIKGLSEAQGKALRLARDVGVITGSSGSPIRPATVRALVDKGCLYAHQSGYRLTEYGRQRLAEG